MYNRRIAVLLPTGTGVVPTRAKIYVTEIHYFSQAPNDYLCVGGIFRCARSYWGCPGDSLSKCMEILELGNRLEWSRGRCNGLSDLVGEFRRGVAEESRSLANVHDSAGFEPHESGAGCISSNRIIREDDLSQKPRSAVKGPVSLHSQNAVRDNEVDRNGCA